MIDDERATIAALLLDARTLRDVAAEVSSDDFADPRIASLYWQITLMPSAGIPIDVLTVSDRLVEWGVRGITAADLHEWISELPTAKNASWYAARVHERGTRRALLDAARRLAEEASDERLNTGIAIAHAKSTLDDVGQHRISTQHHAVPVTTMIAETTTEYDWVIDGLLERGDRLMVTGAEGHGKTTLLRQMAVLAAAGLHPFTIKPMQQPARVLFVDAENSPRMWARASTPMIERARMFGSDPGERMAVWCARRMNVTRDSDLGSIHAAIDEYDPTIVFIGPLYRLLPRAITNDDDAAPLLAALDTIHDRNIALVIEAHAGHLVGPSGSRDLRPRGSSALLGWPEFGFGLRRDAQSRVDEYDVVRWRGDRDERHWPSRLARGSAWPWTATRF